MRSFKDFIIVNEEKIPDIPSKKLKIGDIKTEYKNGLEILVDKKSAINYILEDIFDFYGDFPPLDSEYFSNSSQKTKKDWDEQWKECYDNISDTDKIIFFIIDGKRMYLNKITFDKFIWIYNNLNKLKYFYFEDNNGNIITFDEEKGYDKNTF